MGAFGATFTHSGSLDKCTLYFDRTLYQIRQHQNYSSLSSLPLCSLRPLRLNHKVIGRFFTQKIGSRIPASRNRKFLGSALNQELLKTALSTVNCQLFNFFRMLV
jgi:hypothetical protein